VSAEQLWSAAALTLVLGMTMTVGVLIGVFGVLLGWMFGRRAPHTAAGYSPASSRTTLAGTTSVPRGPQGTAPR
jgi:hypothetical protein